MTETTARLDNGSVAEPAVPEDEMLGMEEGMVEEPAMPEEEMLAMEKGMTDEPAMSEEEIALMGEELLNEAAMAAESADATPRPEEMMAMEDAMAEAEADAVQEDVAPSSPNDAMGSVPSALVCPLPEAMIDTTALEPHPLADLLPRMSASEFADLKESIDIDGLQNAVVLFQGKILDGRNRYQACKELGLPIAIFGFTGTEQQALTYVLSSNRHRRKLTPSQRAVVANEILPKIAGDVNQKRIEKIRQTKRQQASGDTLPILAKCPENDETKISSRVIAAHMMGVSSGYVGDAKRIKEADLELYHEVWAGRVTIPEALRKLDGITADPETVRAKATQRDIGKFLRDPEKRSKLLDRLEAVLAEFR